MAAEQAAATTFVYETAETPEGGRKAAIDKASIPDLPGTYTHGSGRPKDPKRSPVASVKQSNATTNPPPTPPTPPAQADTGISPQQPCRMLQQQDGTSDASPASVIHFHGTAQSLATSIQQPPLDSPMTSSLPAPPKAWLSQTVHLRTDSVAAAPSAASAPMHCSSRADSLATTNANATDASDFDRQPHAFSPSAASVSTADSAGARHCLILDGSGLDAEPPLLAVTHPSQVPGTSAIDTIICAYRAYAARRAAFDDTD
jgi:hypothetical protein